MPRIVATLLALAALLPATARAAGSFVNFETGQVRPLALSPDGTRLFATNTPDNRLEIFTVGPAGITHTGSVDVGMEPIGVAAKSDAEVWVVNHLSDSVSVVDVASTPPRVVRTLLTCDEPRDIVFAGPGNARAFVTTARRGQNCPLTFDFQIAGTPRAIVQVFDSTSLDGTLGGTPIANVELFGDTPRALARSTDGTTVYAAVFHSGNQTTTIGEPTVCDGGADASPCGAFLQFPGGLPAPNTNFEFIPGPETGLIAKFDQSNGHWEDSIGRDWSAAVKFDLPDLDVFAIDATAAVPAQTASFAHVGTELFDMAVNPVSGKIYVSNTEARNDVRFEGNGLAFNTTTVQGHLHEARITVLDGANVLPRHLNKHIDYSQRPAPPGVKEKSLATPVGLAVTSDGTTLYVAAFGSSAIGLFDTSAIEQDTFVPDASTHIALSGGGPTGLVLDEAHDRLYVLTRFDDAVSVVNLTSRAEEAHVKLHTPEPPAVLNGRRFLYDATFTSSNGEASCSSCHVFGDLDSLAWDLGDPDNVVINNPIPVKIPPINIDPNFHPLKGPMTTQSLRGMVNNGSMHWRGDRTGGNDPGGSPFDSEAAFKKFNVAFPGLVGRDSELSDDDMQAFTDFVLTETYPPNPNRKLDNTLNANQQQGHDLFFGRLTDVVFNCDGCHTLDPANGKFATSAFSTFEGETQMFKVPHLRNLYQKVGMFGRPQDTPRGPQVRGFGFLHDGSIDTVRRFLGAAVFTLTGAEQNDLERFVMVMDSDMNPIVGQQVTLDGTNALVAGPRLDLMTQRQDAGECEVVVKGTIDGVARGGYRLSDGTFQMDRAGDVRADADLRALAASGQELTYTCVPPGSGERMGVDRDEDGVLDRDELDVGSDPANAARVPETPIRASKVALKDDVTPPIDPSKRKISFRSSAFHGAPSGVVVPGMGTDGDPTSGGGVGGAELTIHGGAPGNQVLTIELPASGWTTNGNPLALTYKYTDKRNVNGPISSITVRNGDLRIRGRGAALYPLASAPYGSITVRLELGARFGFCATAPAKLPVGVNDAPSRFNGVSNTPPSASCPPLP